MVMLACGACVDQGICAAPPGSSASPMTPITLLTDLKNGTKTKAQLKTALFRYMKQESEQMDDGTAEDAFEVKRKKDIVTYVGLEKNWAIINRHTLAVLQDTLRKLESREPDVRLEGLEDFSKLMLALFANATPQKEQMRALRLLIGQLYFFPVLYFKEIKTRPLLAHSMLNAGTREAWTFFDMGKEFYPLGIESYKHLLKTLSTHPAEQSKDVYWISWGYLQLKQYDEAIAWARKMVPCEGMTEAPARLEKWAREAKAKQKKKKR